MPTDKKYSLWPALIIVCFAFGLPLTIGTFEVRIARNAHAEASALDQLQSIAKAEAAYRSMHNSFAPALEDLKDLPKPEGFYTYALRQLSPTAYVVTASPTEPGKHGKRYFFLDQTGTIRYEVLHPATATSPVIPPPKEPGRE